MYDLVIKDVLMFLDCSPIVRVSIIWTSILLYDGLIGKGLGKTFFACIVFQTPLRRARSMKHILGNNRVKLGIDLRIWKLCRDNGINLLNGRNLVLFFQEDQEMHVRKSTFLIFDSVDKSSHLFKVIVMNLFK